MGLGEEGWQGQAYVLRMRKYCFTERAGARLIEMEADFASDLPEATKHSSGMTLNLRLSLMCKGLVCRLI